MLNLSRPLLPTADALLPYLKQIDAMRWYTNAGLLVTEYEKRLEKIFDCHVVACSSATSGLTASVLALDLKDVAVLPSWTFVATANAFKSAGLNIMFRDIDEHTWDAPAGHRFVRVSPFGAPVSNDAELIDGAAAFDTYATGQSKVGSAPVVISTHATKCFSTGEGGLVLTKDKNFAQEVCGIINHGITLEREVPTAGINGKMSEYHAAVGLASLDAWFVTRMKWFETKCRYIEIFKALAHTTPLSSLSWVGPTFAIRLHGRDIDLIMKYLQKKGIMSRRVWGRGVHRYEAYRDCLQELLLVTEKLADEVLFLPYCVDMPEETIRHIHSEVINAMRECA